jgi:hypothetical protein
MGDSTTKKAFFGFVGFVLAFVFIFVFLFVLGSMDLFVSVTCPSPTVGDWATKKTGSFGLSGSANPQRELA